MHTLKGAKNPANGSDVGHSNGTAFEAVKTAFTGDKTVVLVSDFHRQGDGDVASFTAKMIVSDSDLDPVAPGVQNVFLQGIGCATDAVISFN
jgi:hypothetical protein